MGKNLDSMRAFLALWAQGAWDEALATYVAEDFECHEPPCLPQRGVFFGRDAPKRITAIYTALWDMRIGESALWESTGDSLVISRYIITWTAKATGKSATGPIVELNHFQSGRIQKMEVFHFDPVATLATLEP